MRAGISSSRLIERSLSTSGLEGRTQRPRRQKRAGWGSQSLTTPLIVPDRDAQPQKLDTQYIKSLRRHVTAILEDLAAEVPQAKVHERDR